MIKANLPPRREQDRAAGPSRPVDGDRRKPLLRRLKLFLPTSLRRHGLVRRAHFLDISVVGGRLHAGEPPLVGEAVEIAMSDRWIAAVVQWRTGAMFGVVFAEPLSPEQVEQQLAA